MGVAVLIINMSKYFIETLRAVRPISRSKPKPGLFGPVPFSHLSLLGFELVPVST
ncbi:hypothetical protein DCAR_0417925 [Daucus carota subsp. sativus]|uniref:Uncharacterized protein n=1 Tax=Daucus carota subsp. sativus TaxID=79200 RepID=A0A165Z0W9_DAUCS|nr:hypothetical protein DCAR_0417925 [Daucus carota subsp. sativus]